MIPVWENRLRWFWRKNSPDFWAAVHRRVPDFVFQRNPDPLVGQVPVFTFHYVEPVSFEEQLRFLKDNGYHTLSGKEFEDFLAGTGTAPARSILLTFDDGSASLFSVAFPLLKKYHFRAVSFLIPGLIPDVAPESPTYEDFAAGRASASDLLKREKGGHPLCSWEEIREMHKSGHIEFHAHSLYHHLIPVGKEVIDFFNPAFPTYYFGNINIPVYRRGGRPHYSRVVPAGTPILRAEPRYSALPEFLDNEAAREACVDFVRKKGGEHFFVQPNWRKILVKIYREAVAKLGAGTIQSRQDQEKDILADMQEAKRRIETELPGHKVTQLCYPWFIGSDLAVALSKQAGYRVNYWGVISHRSTNRPGDDPFYCPRVEDRFLYRLPGKGRLSFWEVLRRKVVRYGGKQDPILHQSKVNEEKPSQISA